MSHKWQVLTIAILTLPLLSNATAEQGGMNSWRKLRMAVTQSREEVRRVGISAYIQGAGRQTEPFLIHSQCWVDWLPAEEVERKAYEQEKRAFGLDILGQLETLALQQVNYEDLAALRERVDVLLEIAGWLKKTPGYGNYILKRWAEDMAVGCIARLAVDGSCSVDEVERLLSGVDTQAQCVPMQVVILNEESPDQWVMPKNRDHAQDELIRAWERRMLSAEKYFASRRPNRMNVQFDEVKDEDHRYAFYIPDVNPGDATLRRCWGLKDHEEVCIYGMYNNMRADVERILRWRKASDEFPRPTKDDLKDEVSRERYIDRMDILCSSKGRSFGLKPCGRLIVRVLRNRFVDPYTRMLQMEKGGRI